MPLPQAREPATDWELLELRARIRMLDTQLIVLLARRFDVVAQISTTKQKHGLASHDPEREQAVLDHCVDLALSLDVPVSVVHALYGACFTAARGEAHPATP